MKVLVLGLPLLFLAACGAPLVGVTAQDAAAPLPPPDAPQTPADAPITADTPGLPLDAPTPPQDSGAALDVQPTEVDVQTRAMDLGVDLGLPTMPDVWETTDTGACPLTSGPCCTSSLQCSGWNECRSLDGGRFSGCQSCGGCGEPPCLVAGLPCQAGLTSCGVCSFCDSGCGSCAPACP